MRQRKNHPLCEGGNMIEVNIRKKAGPFTLSVQFRAENERLGLLGASGCGKSMTLRCIAGITRPDSGRIVLNGRTVFDSERNINLPPQQRHVGYLFQQYALFPTMTVRENLEIVLTGLPRRERRLRAEAMLARLGMQKFGNYRPSRLSGGQQQRAAIGRILVRSPEILMLDEPFSALDSYLRLSVEAELAEILRRFDGTILFVSHNRDEIYRICGRMLVLHDGGVSVTGTTEELFRNPQTLPAARLTGVKNIAAAFPVGERTVRVPDWGLDLETAHVLPGAMTHVAVRAHHIREAGGQETVNCFEFRVSRRQSEPFRIQEFLTLASPGGVREQRPDAAAIVRLISGAFDPVPPAQDSCEVRRFCIPPEHVMLLRDGRGFPAASTEPAATQTDSSVS
jgi:molybdate transport system ATP-binding protein